MITKKLLREWSACWSDSQIDSAFGGRAEVSPRDVALAATRRHGWITGMMLAGTLAITAAGRAALHADAEARKGGRP